MSHRTSQSPISANRSGSVIGANTSVRRAAVSAPKRAAAIRHRSARCWPTPCSTLFATFREALLASFPQPLLGPLGCPFDQCHPHILQGPHRRHHRTRRRHPLGDLPYPVHERAPQLRRAWILQPELQCITHPQHVPERPTLLQAGHRVQQVAARQIVGRHALQVKQEVALRRLIRRQPRSARSNQPAHLSRRGPRLGAVVEHDRQHRRQPPIGYLRRLVAHQLLVEQAGVGEDTQRHPAIVLGLELQQDQQIHPVLAEAQAPDGVAVALAQLVADVLGGELAQLGEVGGGQQVQTVSCSIVGSALPIAGLPAPALQRISRKPEDATVRFAGCARRRG